MLCMLGLLLLRVAALALLHGRAALQFSSATACMCARCFPQLLITAHSLTRTPSTTDQRACGICGGRAGGRGASGHAGHEGAAGLLLALIS